MRAASTAICTLYALPPGAMAGVLEVGTAAATALFGAEVGRVFGLAIAFGPLSVMSAMIMAGPRVYFAMARDGLLFRRFGRVLGYPLTPWLFIAGNLWIMLYTIASRPIVGLFGLATLALGVLLYWAFRRH
jgi:APA family basic amino acid/polyamine antiporter